MHELPMTSRITLTYEDYAALPDDGKRYELHEGELSVTPAPGTRHQQILVNLTVLFAPPVEGCDEERAELPSLHVGRGL